MLGVRDTNDLCGGLINVAGPDRASEVADRGAVGKCVQNADSRLIQLSSGGEFWEDGSSVQLDITLSTLYARIGFDGRDHLRRGPVVQDGDKKDIAPRGVQLTHYRQVIPDGNSRDFG